MGSTQTPIPQLTMDVFRRLGHLGVFCFLFIQTTRALRVYKTREIVQADGPSGEPLFLTPYIESGKITEGRNKSRVSPLIGDVESFAGFLTVDKTFDSNMYFWYFPSESDPENAPVLLWLQGGPGAPSLYGLFEEIGPFYVAKKSQRLKKRRTYWSQQFNVVYIDNPVSVGFSFTRDTRGYAQNEVDVGRNLYAAMVQFFKLFPNLQNNDFYITGESYGGKYVPALAYYIHEQNPTAELKVNLKGISIGNGWIDPVSQLNYADLLYQIGLIDSPTQEEFRKKQNNIISLINNQKYVEAFWALDSFIDGDLTPYKTLFYNVTGYNYYMNYLSNDDDERYGDMDNYLEKHKVRQAIHVGQIPFNDTGKAEWYLMIDEMSSVKTWFQVLMDNYRVLLYNGQLDLICAYSLTMDFLKSLEWKGKQAYQKAERHQWYVKGELAGYRKTAGDFTEVLVRNAGHTVPTYQPVWAMNLISDFVNKIF